MSADLFAEFASFSSNNPKPNQTAPLQSHSQSQTRPLQNTTADPFDFLFSPSGQTASPQTLQYPTKQPWPSAQQQQSQMGSNAWGGLGAFQANTNVAHQPAQETGDDDDFGDFEEAPAAPSAKPPPTILGSNLPSTAVPATANQNPSPAVRNRIHRADTMDLMSNNLLGGLGGAKAPEPWQERPSWEAAPAATNPAGSRAPVQMPKLSPPLPNVSRPKIKTADSNVLFDADEFDGLSPEDEDDDFGDFETGNIKATPKPAAPAQPALIDLMSIDFGAPSPEPSPSNPSAALGASETRKPPPKPIQASLSLATPSLSPNPLYPQAPRSPSFSDRNPFPGLAVTTPVSGSFPPELENDVKEKSPTPVTAWPTAQSAVDKDDWDAFADFPPDASSATPGASSSWDWDAVDAPAAAPAPAAPRRTSQTSSKRKASIQDVVGPPPTNVPPPSILLSIFPGLLEEADTKLYKPTASQTPAVKSRIYADPATLDYLKGYLILATVAARIVAGRKHRWHRDKFLSQGMSISAAGSKGGMKLTGIDKTQATREDREAADVVGVWRDHVGKLKSAVAAANIGIQKQIVKLEPLQVPEINDHMIVSMAKVVPTAPKACCVCGLKRDERIKGVDFEVEDSFGEWWVDHCGHRACLNFWLGNEERLRSR